MYILIEIIDRDINTDIYNTFELAQQEMMKRLKDTIHDDEEFEAQYFRGNEWDFREDRAWSNYSADYDWKILSINI